MDSFKNDISIKRLKNVPVRMTEATVRAKRIPILLPAKWSWWVREGGASVAKGCEEFKVVRGKLLLK